MIQLLKKGILFLVLFFVFDLLVSLLISNLYFNQKKGVNARITYILNEMETPTVILGASKANHSYIPDTLESYLGMSCFNCGKDASSIYYQYALLLSILERYTPRLIILDVAAKDLVYDSNDFDKLNRLLPYYSSHKELQKLLQLRSPFEKLKLFSKVYPYNSLLHSIVWNYLWPLEDKKGYMPINKMAIPLEEKELTYKQKFTIDTSKVRIIESIINICENNKILLVPVLSPSYIKMEDNSLDRLSEIFNNSPYKLIDYLNNPDYQYKHELFADDSHLNHTGAVLFSSEISSEIIKFLK